ncbi:hypothetical protein ACHWQZ_G001268 [Mnemiopsis leidyi]
MSIKIFPLLLIVSLTEALKVSPSSREDMYNMSTHPPSDEEFLNKCLEVGLSISPEQGRLFFFTTSGSLQCWLYCKYTLQCFVVNFNSLNSSCSLFTEKFVYSVRTLESPDFVIRKQCMENKPALKILAASVSHPYPGPKFLIQQIEPSIACLTKGGLEASHLDGNSSYRLTWKSCAETISWSLRKIERLSTKIDTNEFFQIYSSENPDMCMDAFVPADIGKMQGILTKCRESTLLDHEDSQLMFFRNEERLSQSLNYRYFDGLSINSLAGVFDESFIRVIFPSPGDDYNRPLNGLLFTKASSPPELYQSGCDYQHFITPHSSLESREDVPFFLPGEEVEVVCDMGYGVSSLNSSLQTLTCGEDEGVEPCTLLTVEKSEKNERTMTKEKESEEDERCFMFLVFGIVGFAIAFIELVVILRNRGELEASKNVVLKTEKSDDRLNDIGLGRHPV